ncbi:MAG: exonuclease domain-containing protein [Pseudomonadales bacterium]
MANFIALDVETANADMASICQIGIAKFEGGKPVAEWSSLIDPEDEFDGMNVSIHGIDERTVRGAPRFPDVRGVLAEWCEGNIVVCHTHFDRTSVHQASSKYRLPPPEWTWLDSAKVARRTWGQFAQRGYGLGNLCEFLGYSYRAHDALEDAKACGVVLCRAMEESGLAVADWLKRVKGPLVIGPSSSSSSSAIHKMKGNPNGPLYGETIVFTGALSLPRRQATELAAEAGADVSPGINRWVTTLVVGEQDIRSLAGHKRSSKHRKALELIAQGQDIRIIGESGFLELLRLTKE